MKNLLYDGMPCLDDNDLRNEWLQRKCVTFSNVYEAIEFLDSIP